MPSLATYFKLYATLCVLTCLTVAVYYMDLGRTSLIVALAIAIVKASLVAAVFMHLWYERRFYVLMVAISLIVLIFFFVFPFIDMGSRADVNPSTGPRIEAGPASK